MNELCSIGVMFIHRGVHSLLFRRMVGRTEDLPSVGANFTPGGQSSPLGDKVHPWGTTSSLGYYFTPGSQISPLGARLKIGLCTLVGFDLPTQEHYTE
jgi:hypothetical protein